MYVRVRQLCLAVVGAGLVSLVGVVLPAQAQTATPGSANTLRVAPLRTDVTLDPGKQATVRLTVTNPTDQTIMVSPLVNDFVAEGEDGAPALILNEGSHANHHSLKRLIAPLELVTIPPKASQVVEVVIAAPASLEPGGYFGAVRFAPTTPGSGGQVNMSASVASLILLRVTGDAPEQLRLTDLAMQQQGATKTFFMDTTDLSVVVRFENEGGVQLAPLGKLSIMRGDELVFAADFNDKLPHDLVLPNSARRWNLPVDNLDGAGKYTLMATITYGSTNQTVEVTSSFWVIPRSLIAVAAGSVVLLVAIVAGVVLRRRAMARRRPRFGHRR